MIHQVYIRGRLPEWRPRPEQHSITHFNYYWNFTQRIQLFPFRWPGNPSRYTRSSYPSVGLTIQLSFLGSSSSRSVGYIILKLPQKPSVDCWLDLWKFNYSSTISLTGTRWTIDVPKVLQRVHNRIQWSHRTLRSVHCIMRKILYSVYLVRFLH